MRHSPIGSRRRLKLPALQLLIASLFTGLLWHTAASAAPRNFPMALWGTSDRVYTDFSWFWLPEAQPPRTAILRLDGYYQDSANLTQMLTNSGYDWSRIAAVWIDEPYLTAVGEKALPCAGGSSRTKMIDTQAQVEAAARTVRSMSSNTRVWVNFSATEIGWMKGRVCPFDLNQTYIDVISIDYYKGPFDQIRQEYDWLKANPATPYQQRALVPLVASKLPPNAISPATAAAWLLAYFEYATLENQSCDLPLGPAGVTGLRDGCSVWAVAGWPGVDYTVDGYVGFFDPTSAPIRDAWHTQRQVIRSDQIIGILGPLNVGLEEP